MLAELRGLPRLFLNARLSSGDLEALRVHKLRALIRHAYEHVPYYRARFDAAGVGPDDVRSVEDLRLIPITSKDDLRAAGEEDVRARGSDVASCIRLSTSGTSGKPLNVYCTPREMRTARLLNFRTLLSIGLRPRDRIAILGQEPTEPVPLYQRLGLYRGTAISPMLSIAEQIRRLQHIQPTVLWAYPSALQAVLQPLGDRLSRIVRPRLLIVSAEVFSHALQRRIEADLPAEVFQFYGAVEFGRIAAECSAHQGLHVLADHVILECIPDGADGSAAGVAVITNLDTFTMPMIRYRIGDLCTPIESPCVCGSAFPLIGPPGGRAADVIRLPSGKLLSAMGPRRIIEELPGLHQFRLIQRQPDHLVVQLVTLRRPADEALAQLRSSLTGHLGEPVRLDIQLVEQIEQEGPKFRSFVSDFVVDGGTRPQ